MELPFSDDNLQPATRTPQLEVSFSGAAESVGGGLMDAVSSVASAVGVALSSDSADPWQRSVAEVISQSFIAPQVGQAIVTLINDSQSPEFNVGDSGHIKMGYVDDQMFPVFTGTITSVELGLDGHATLRACSAAFDLSQRRINQSFDKQTAGDIVQVLADIAGVETDTIESGIDLPFYVIDDGKNLYQHTALLAEKSGLVSFISTENKLNFIQPASGNAAKIFTYGVDLIRMKVINTAPSVSKLTVVGAGAAGGQGAEAWSWLVKDPQSVSVTVGEGDNARLVSDAGLGSAAAVQQAAAAKLFLSNQGSSKAKLTVVGAADINAGSKIEIMGVPQVGFDGTGIVESARHLYSKDKGYVTELVVLMETGDEMGGFLSDGLGGLL